MTEFYRRGFLVLTVVALGYAVWEILTPFWGALAWSIVLAVLMAPLQSRLANGFGSRPGAAAAVLTVLTPVVVFAPLVLLGASFIEQGRTLIYDLQHSAWRIDSDTLNRLEEYPVLGPVLADIVDLLDLEGSQITGFVVTIGQTFLRYAASLGSSMVIGALGTTVAFLLMLFFMLRDGGQMLQRLGNLVPIDREHREQLLALIANTTRAVVYGSGLTALLQGLLIGIAFAIVGLPSPVVFGVLAALFSLLPAGGTAFVWIPATLALAGMGRSGAALFMLAWGGFVSIVDNFIRPLLVSKQAHVSTLAVFVGVIGGAAAFGGVGLVVGPVVLTLVSALLRFAEEKRLGQSD
ncbi:MAG: AI-2E family transporter [Steroidobacteraceae bacterium]